MPFLYCEVAMACWVTQLSGAPNPDSEPVRGWIQPIVISLLSEPLPLLLPLRPELQASSRVPPPRIAAPTPAARNRLRLETAVWSVICGCLLIYFSVRQ